MKKVQEDLKYQKKEYTDVQHELNSKNRECDKVTAELQKLTDGRTALLEKLVFEQESRSKVLMELAEAREQLQRGGTYIAVEPNPTPNSRKQAYAKGRQGSASSSVIAEEQKKQAEQEDADELEEVEEEEISEEEDEKLDDNDTNTQKDSDFDNSDDDFIFEEENEQKSTFTLDDIHDENPSDPGYNNSGNPVFKAAADDNDEDKYEQTYGSASDIGAGDDIQISEENPPDIKLVKKPVY